MASGAKSDGTYGRLWFAELIGQEEVAFESSVFLLTKAKAKELKVPPEQPPLPPPEPPPPEIPPESVPPAGASKTMLRLSGTVPPEVWNRLGTKVLPKLRSGDDLSIGIEFSVSVGSNLAKNLETELKQILDDLGLSDRVRLEKSLKVKD